VTSRCSTRIRLASSLVSRGASPALLRRPDPFEQGRRGLPAVAVGKVLGRAATGLSQRPSSSTCWRESIDAACLGPPADPTEPAFFAAGYSLSSCPPLTTKDETSPCATGPGRALQSIPASLRVVLIAAIGLHRH